MQVNPSNKHNQHTLTDLTEAKFFWKSTISFLKQEILSFEGQL